MSLDLDITVLFAFGLAILIWWCSLVLIDDVPQPLALRRFRLREVKWKKVPLSFLGLAWLSFGAGYVFRFLFLVYDPELFRASEYPMWLLSAGRLFQCWIYIALFWLILCFGYFLTTRVKIKLPSLFGKLNLFSMPINYASLKYLYVFSFLLVLVVHGIPNMIPKALLTPLGLLSALWIFPAAIMWYWHFSGISVGKRRYYYLMPGVITYLLSPYREHLVLIGLCILLPAIMTGKRIKIVSILTASLAILLLITPITDFFRSLKWGGLDFGEASEELNISSWEESSSKTPWVKLADRFHYFDATALTMALVPDVFPFERRNLITELFESLMPRVLDPYKEDIKRGRLFSLSIWAYQESGEVVEGKTSSMIAPSMPGDLWSSGGVLPIVVGGFIYGLVLGMLDRWRKILNQGAGAALLITIGIRILGAIERDFVNGLATVLQIVAVLLMVTAVARLKKSTSVDPLKDRSRA